MSKYSAVVDIDSDLAAATRSRLLASVYRFSHAGTVVLVLRDVSRSTIDAILNPVVDIVGVNVRGTLYVDASDLPTVLAGVYADTIVVGSSPTFCAECLSRGIATISVEEAVGIWEEIATASPPVSAPAR